jgi:hypothetical protein
MDQQDTDRALEPGQFADGDEVRAADDEPLGHVVGFWPSRDEPTHLIVAGAGNDPGADSGGDAATWYVPTTAIAGFQPGLLLLAATLAAARAAGWQEPPAGEPAAGDASGN